VSAIVRASGSLLIHPLALQTKYVRRAAIAVLMRHATYAGNIERSSAEIEKVVLFVRLALLILRPRILAPLVATTCQALADRAVEAALIERP
jgi:hypothetical protein